MNWSLPGNRVPASPWPASSMFPAVRTRPSLATRIFTGGGRSEGERTPFTVAESCSIDIVTLATPSWSSESIFQEMVSAAFMLKGICWPPADTFPLKARPIW